MVKNEKQEKELKNYDLQFKQISKENDWQWTKYVLP